MSEHPDIDCFILNSGVQHTFDFSKPETVDMDKFQADFTTNYLSNVLLTKTILPYLLKRGGPAALVL
jgi:short-subunit dehydrogenase involved in D-alanine esterification of teichoic acids